MSAQSISRFAFFLLWFITLNLQMNGQTIDPMMPGVIRLHDTRLKVLLDRQVTDPASPFVGAIPDDAGLHQAGAAGGLLKNAAAAYLHPDSGFHRDPLLFARMQIAAAFLERCQTADGNTELLTTNFNSPPDTGFVVQNVATAAKIARLYGDDALFALMEPFLLRSGEGMVKGGIHTPNHRWVVSAALAQLNDLFPDERYVERIDAWLAEGIDIDRYGQYIERSTTVYNAVTDTALVLMALKLNRPELFDPVRRNLDAMARLLHANGEVVTEISRRQDLNTRGDLRRYWFALRTLAVRDRNGLYAAMLAPLEPDRADLARLMEFPDLRTPLPALETLPDDFEDDYRDYALTQIRRGRRSASILQTGQSRWVSLRQGEAVIPAIRFATAFFGKGQFIPTAFERTADGFRCTQDLEGPYFQPLDRIVPPEKWAELREERRQTEVGRMHYEGFIRETESGFEITIRASGTNGVPIAIEIALREGGEISGVEAIEGKTDVLLLKEGQAEYAMGSDRIRFGPGRAEHAYVAVRGAEAKPEGPCIYLTGFTPWEHTLVFAME